MKKILLNLPLSLLVLLSLTFTACKKESAGDDSQSAQDVTAVSNAVNSTADDATNASAQISNISGKTNGVLAMQYLCAATVTQSDSTLKQFTVAYDGKSNCQGVIRSGTVTIALTSGTHWRDQNAVITISTTNLSFSDVITAQTYSVSGTITITNESGGLAYDVFVNNAAGPIQHRHQGSLQVTFPGGGQRTWTFDRTRIYTRTNNNYVNIELLTEAANNVDATGTNRFGETFTNSITSPLQATNNPGCLWKPWTGTYQHQISNRTASITFGTDNTGKQIGAEGVCESGEGYYINYSRNNKTYSKFVQYW